MAGFQMLAASVAVLAALSCGTAFGAPTGALSLDGTGYATTPTGVSAASIDLTMSTRTAGSGTALVIAGGELAYGDDRFDALSIDGVFLRDAKFIQLTGIAESQEGALEVKLLGRLVAEKEGGSIYLVTGTLERDDYAGKAVLAASLSQFAAPAAADTRPTPGGSVAISILGGTPDGGVQDGYLNVTTVEVRPGEPLTITNEDETTHRLVSGNFYGWTYERDGPPRVCDADGEPEDAAPASTTAPRTGTYISGGTEHTVTIPEASASRSTSDPGDVTGCDFIRDGRIDITLESGGSATIEASERGFYRLLDVSKPWIKLLIVAIAPSPTLG